MVRKQDVIEFEEETEGPRISIGGVVGALFGALIGYKWAQQTPLGGEPKPLPSMFTLTEDGTGPDLVDVSLKMGLLAAAGYMIGSFVSKVRAPRRFMLRHKD